MTAKICAVELSGIRAAILDKLDFRALRSFVHVLFVFVVGDGGENRVMSPPLRVAGSVIVEDPSTQMEAEVLTRFSIVEFSRMKWFDAILTGVELAIRRAYFQSSYFPALYLKWRIHRLEGSVVNRERLRDHLQRIGVCNGALIMLHSSVQGISFMSDAQDEPASTNPLLLLHDLMELIGDAGTLAMPTHPYYRDDPGFMYDKSNLIFRYNPRRTPSRVGFLTEVFRRLPHVKRSQHPLSSLACSGPLASTLLRDNLNKDNPLPHGVHSGYHRFCQQGGLVISIGVPLIRSMTVMHVAEELSEARWPVKNFFYKRRFIVSVDNEDKEWVVRERRPEFVRSIALSKLRRDLLREGILHETKVCGIRLDWANAGEVLSFMMKRNRSSTYPHYWPSLVRLSR